MSDPGPDLGPVSGPDPGQDLGPVSSVLAGFAVYMYEPGLTEWFTCDWQSCCLCSGTALKTDTPGVYGTGGR